MLLLLDRNLDLSVCFKGEKEQPVFALLGLRWGAFRDAAATISKYDYTIV